MVSLSDQYAAATTEAEKSQLLTAGAAVQEVFEGTAHIMHYVLGTISLLIFSLLMLENKLYTKVTTYVGIGSNLLAFALFTPTVGVYLSLISVFGLAVWDILIARVFFYNL